MRISVYQRTDDIFVPDGQVHVKTAYMHREEGSGEISAKTEHYPILCIRESVSGNSIDRHFVIKDDKGPATLSSLFKENFEDPAHLWSENYDLKKKVERLAEEAKQLKEASLFERIFRWKKRQL